MKGRGLPSWPRAGHGIGQRHVSVHRGFLQEGIWIQIRGRTLERYTRVHECVSKEQVRNEEGTCQDGSRGCKRKHRHATKLQQLRAAVRQAFEPFGLQGTRPFELSAHIGTHAHLGQVLLPFFLVPFVPVFRSLSLSLLQCFATRSFESELFFYRPITLFFGVSSSYFPGRSSAATSGWFSPGVERRLLDDPTVAGAHGFPGSGQVPIQRALFSVSFQELSFDQAFDALRVRTFHSSVRSHVRAHFSHQEIPVVHLSTPSPSIPLNPLSLNLSQSPLSQSLSISVGVEEAGPSGGGRTFLMAGGVGMKRLDNCEVTSLTKLLWSRVRRDFMMRTMAASI